MKNKLIFYITILIFVFSAAFFLSDRVSFAADSVTYDVETSTGDYGAFGANPGFRPFIVYAHIKYPTGYSSYIVCGRDGDQINCSGSIKDHFAYHGGFQGIYYFIENLHNPNNPPITFNVTPSVPVINLGDLDRQSQIGDYINRALNDPSLIPINVNSYDNSLGSLQLKDSTSWRLLRYEPILDDEPASLPNIFKVKLRAEFQDTTSTGQSYDMIQVMVRVKNIRSQFLASNTYPWKNKFSKDEYYSYYLTDLKSPTIVDLQTHDYTKREEDGHINFNISYPLFQPCIDHFALTKPIFANDDWFLCDYTVCYRPVTTDGKFGDWFYITPDNNYLGHNIDGNSSSISATTGTSLSDADPNSLSFNPLPEDSTSSRTAIGKGSTLENAIANSNNSLVGGGITSGGSLTSNITDLFSFFTNLPLIISTIFGWLPPWVLSLFAIGFALFVPIFIYKFVRG